MVAAASAHAMAQAADEAVSAVAPSDKTDAAATPTVLITARKRTEAALRVPLSVSVLTHDEFVSRQMVQLTDLGRAVPNMDVNRFGVGNPAHAAIFLRGVGVQDHIITTDPAVGLYVDGVPLGRQMGANLRLADVERIEVLRGPQGTLFGRNTLGGAVHVVTRAPDDAPRTQATLRVGSRGRAEAGFTANERAGAHWSWRASALVTRRDGVGRALLVDAPREVGQEDEAAGRLALQWRATPALSLRLALDAVRGDNGKTPSTMQIFDPAGYFPSQLGLSEAQLPADPDDSHSGQAELLRQTHGAGGLALTAVWRIGDRLRATLLAGVRESRYAGGLDDDHTLADLASFPERGTARQATVEARLDGRLGGVDLVGGVFVGRERGQTNSGPWVYVEPGGFFDVRQRQHSEALFGHAAWPLDDAWRMEAGLRHTLERKDASAQFDAWSDPTRVQRRGRWGAWTGEMSLLRTVGEAAQAYGTVSTGFQSGGFPPRPFGGPEAFQAFRPTTALNVEAGLKGRLLPALRGSVAVFHTRYDDIPLQVAVPSGSVFVFLTDNGGRATARGLEFEGRWDLGAGWSVTSAFGYLDAAMRAVPPQASAVRVGDRLPHSPRWTLALAPRHVMRLRSGATLDSVLDVAWRSGAFGQLANADANAIDGRTLVNAQVAYTPAAGRWTLALYGRNVFDEVYDVARLDSAFAGFTDVIRNNDRRELGLSLGLSY